MLFRSREWQAQAQKQRSRVLRQSSQAPIRSLRSFSHVEEESRRSCRITTITPSDAGKDPKWYDWRRTVLRCFWAQACHSRLHRYRGYTCFQPLLVFACTRSGLLQRALTLSLLNIPCVCTTSQALRTVLQPSDSRMRPVAVQYAIQCWRLRTTDRPSLFSFLHYIPSSQINYALPPRHTKM